MNTLQPILGTALWGWIIEKETAFELLDYFYEKGHRRVDCATNYPINKNEADFRKAEKILLEWIRANGIEDLELMTKVGSIHNLGTPENNLTKSFLLINLDYYQGMFKENLDCFMIHWDNREDENEIAESIKVLDIANERGLKIGLSGIKHPEMYAAFIKDSKEKIQIQIKHNLLASAYHHYDVLNENAAFLVYGINAGGIKLNAKRYNENNSYFIRTGKGNNDHPIINELERELFNVNEALKIQPAITTFNECGMIFAAYTKGVSSVILGTSSIEQLDESLNFIESLQKNNYEALYLRLKNLHERHQG